MMLTKRAQKRHLQIVMEFDDHPEKLRGNNSEEGVRQYAKYILERIRAPQGAHVLELGCGDGRILQKMREIRSDLHFRGMDLCPKLVQNARVLNPEIVITTGNCLGGVPFVQSFDRIVSFGFGQYFTHREFIQLNQTLLSKLRSGGFITHCSIPDLAKCRQYETRDRKGVWALFKGIIKWLVQSCSRKYGLASYWHNPRDLAKALSSFSSVKMHSPSDSWYRFDLEIEPRITLKG